MTHLSQDKHNYIVVIQWKRVRNICAYFFSAVQLETLTRNCEGEGIAGN